MAEAARQRQDARPTTADYSERRMVGQALALWERLRGARAFPSRADCQGVATGDMGIGRNGEKTAAWQPGRELHGKDTFFAEGCRGQHGKQLAGRVNYAALAGDDSQPGGDGRPGAGESRG